jgi:hypothetical protein
MLTKDGADRLVQAGLFRADIGERTVEVTGRHLSGIAVTHRKNGGPSG